MNLTRTSHYERVLEEDQPAPATTATEASSGQPRRLTLTWSDGSEGAALAVRSRDGNTVTIPLEPADAVRLETMLAEFLHAKREATT